MSEMRRANKFYSKHGYNYVGGGSGEWGMG